MDRRRRERWLDEHAEDAIGLPLAEVADELTSSGLTFGVRRAGKAIAAPGAWDVVLTVGADDTVVDVHAR